MFIFVIRIIENPLSVNPKISYRTATNFIPIERPDNVVYEIIDRIECEADEVDDELIYVNEDINSGSYDNHEPIMY